MVLLRNFCLALVSALCPVSSALAQNWSFDARSIALGNVSGGDNLASRMVDEQRQYAASSFRSGLFQVLREWIASSPNPMSSIWSGPSNTRRRRCTSSSGETRSRSPGRNLFTDIRECDAQPRPQRLSRLQAGESAGRGRAGEPVVGRDDPRQRREGRPFQGIFVGAGPYLVMRAAPRSIRASSTSSTARIRCAFRTRLSARQRPAGPVRDGDHRRIPRALCC